MDRVVLDLHRVGERGDIGLVRGVVGDCRGTARSRRATPRSENPSATLAPASAALKLSRSRSSSSRSRYAIGPLHDGRFIGGALRPINARWCEFGKLDHVGGGERGALGGLVAEAAQAVLDVGRVADFAHLAVVDDVDADLGLFANDLGHGRAHARLQSAAVDEFAGLPGETAYRPGRRAVAGCRYGWSESARCCASSLATPDRQANPRFRESSTSKVAPGATANAGPRPAMRPARRRQASLYSPVALGYDLDLGLAERGRT